MYDLICNKIPILNDKNCLCLYEGYRTYLIMGGNIGLELIQPTK